MNYNPYLVKERLSIMNIVSELNEIIDLNHTLNNAIEFSSENGEDSTYIIRLAKIIHDKLNNFKENISINKLNI